MTIAAGFQCKDGVVLCADTQQTMPGLIKFPGSKIKMFSKIKWRPFCTFAGDVHFCETIIRTLAKALSMTDEKSGPLDALETGAWSIHQKYKKEEYEAYATVLLSLWDEEGKRRMLFQISRGLVIPVSRVTCIGSGLLVAQGMAIDFFKPTMTLSEAGRLALFVLAEAKAYADGCGKESQVLLLRDNGTWELFSEQNDPSDFTVAEFEEEYFAFKRFMRPLLMEWGRVHAVPGDLEKAGHKFITSLVARRKTTYAKHIAELEAYHEAAMQTQIEAAERGEEEANQDEEL